MKNLTLLIAALLLVSCSSMWRKNLSSEQQKQAALERKLLSHSDPEVRQIAIEERQSRDHFASHWIADPQTEFQKGYNSALIKKRDREVAELNDRANRKKTDADLSKTIEVGRSCFSQKFEGETVTGIGLTFEEAQLDLHKKIPSLGILQTINLEQKKMLVGDSYSETSLLKSHLSANIDNVLTQNCKLNGLFAISAIIPQGSINYIPKAVSDIANVSDKADFVQAGKLCGNDQYTVIVSMNDHFEISGGKIAIQNNNMGIHTVIVCGQFKLQTKWFNHGWTTDVREIFANKYNLIYLGSYRDKDIRDYYKEFHLEMVKNAIAKK
jgi:hypothetical protein